MGLWKVFAPLGKLKDGLARTRAKITAGLKGLFRGRVDPAVLDELEEVLITSDVGVAATTRLLEEIRAAHKAGRIPDGATLKTFLKNQLRQLLAQEDNALRLADSPPTVILVAGVNGTGKTTSIAKLGHYFHEEGKTVLLAASDTFRAAAVEQLEIWSRRIGVDIVRHQTGADPAAVAYDAAEAAVARGADVLIVDTAGRLHTRQNLMRELSKIQRVLRKVIPEAPHEALLVLDATTGQNAIAQAETFAGAVDLTGIFLAKLDGTAKGGIVVAIRQQVDLPVKFIGIGETPEDIESFDADRFVEAMFGDD